MNPGKLYLIPVSLRPALKEAGRLDCTLPAEVQQITASLSYFIAENARSARAHLNEVALAYPLQTPLQQIDIAELNQKTPVDALPVLLRPILEGKDAGLLSEAGVPAVADPGANLIRLAQQAGIMVTPLVGPSAILLALMASGLNGQSFAFNGYLPSRPDERNKRIIFYEKRSRQEKQTQIFIETPYRNQALLEGICTQCQDDTYLCIATDLTLESERVETLPIREWKTMLKSGKGPDLNRKPSIFLFLGV